MAVVSAAQAAGPPPADLRACTDQDYTLGPVAAPSGSDVMLGPLIFMRLGRYASRREFEHFRGDGYAMKLPVFVSVGAAVTLDVPASHRDVLKLGYVRNPTRAAVRIKSCPARLAAGRYGVLGQVGAFPGGVDLPGPRCAPIRAWLDGQAQPLRATLSFGMGRCPLSPTERAVRRGIAAFTEAMQSGVLSRFCAVLLDEARRRQGCGTNDGDIGPALTTTIKRASDVKLLWTQGNRATIEIPAFQGNRQFGRMRLAAGRWRVYELNAPACDAALRCS